MPKNRLIDLSSFCLLPALDLSKTASSVLNGTPVTLVEHRGSPKQTAIKPLSIADSHTSPAAPLADVVVELRPVR
jgi:hypothetical protein